MLRAALLLIPGILLTWGWVAKSNAQKLETQQSRASFLQHIVTYTSFPQGFDEKRPALFCFLESAPYTYFSWFENSAETARLRQRAEIRLLQSVQSLQDLRCDFLFVGATQESDQLFAMLSEREASLVSIGETRHFLQHGGLMSLVAQQARIKLLVNRQQYASSDLKFSAKLLRHASFR